MRKLLIVFSLFWIMVVAVGAQRATPEVDPPPQYVDEAVYALVSVNRANLRTAPSISNSVVVDIAIYGERYPIVGAFYPGESTVIDPVDETFVYDDANEREVWYLLAVNGGQAWIFGGLVAVANEDDLPDYAAGRDLTPAEQARLDAQLAYVTNTIGLRVNGRLRSGAGTDYRVMTVIPYGSRVTPIGRNRYSTWIQVNYDGTIGWLSLGLLAFPPGYNLQALPLIGE